MARISSRKIETRNGRARHDFAGRLPAEKYGVVFSGDALILNMKDENRAWALILTAEETAFLAQRFDEWRAVSHSAVSIRDRGVEP